MSLLEVEGLRAAYGQVGVLEGIDFSVERGQKVAMLGPNGAGKTTVLRALSGMVQHQRHARSSTATACVRPGHRRHRAARRGARTGGARHLRHPCR